MRQPLKTPNKLPIDFLADSFLVQQRLSLCMGEWGGGTLNIEHLGKVDLTEHVIILTY